VAHRGVPEKTIFTMLQFMLQTGTIFSNAEKGAKILGLCEKNHNILTAA
jgi:hypothetical protein